MADRPLPSKRLWSIALIILAGVLVIWWRMAESRRERSREAQARERSQPVVSAPYTPRAFDGQPLRVLPEHRPAAERPAFAPQPSDVEIAASRVFSRRLVPIEWDGKNAAARETENTQFAEFLRRAANLDPDERAEAARAFLKEHPGSRWATVLRLESAAQRFRRGYFAEAREEWDRLWKQLQARRDTESMGLADEVLGRLLETSIGRSDAARLKELIAEAEERPHHGALEGVLFRARQGVWLTEHTGAQNVRCGPLALHAIKDFKGERYSPVRLGKVPASYIATGLPLSEVANYANGNYRLPSKMVRRTDAAAPLALPAVMHLKGDHYAALLAEENGRYYLDDRSLGFQGWIDRQAIEQMSSGHFLLASNTLPNGYSELTNAEGQNIFGRDGAHGQTPTDESETDNGPEEGDDDCKGMARYAFNPALASIHLMDMPVGYAPPVGPAVACRLVHKQLDTSQPTTAPSYAHVGKVWSIDWVAYVEHVPGTLFNGTSLRVHPRGGGTEVVTYSTTTAQFGPDDMSFATVKRTGTATYTREFPDGSKEVFNTPDNPTTPGKVFLSQVIDPFGNAITFTYDATLRLVGITDAIGQVTTLQYNHPTDAWLITSVTDPFLRMASLTYDASGRLLSITDVIGLVSSFTYGTNDRVATLTTPYGTTQFAYTGGYPTRTLQITDPQGDIEKVEFADPGPVIPSLRPPPRYVNVGGQTIPFYAENERLEYRNSYYWSKIAWAAAPGDYKAARNYRWYTGSGNWLTSPILEAVKEPLEDRVWFNYPGSAEDAGDGLPGYPGQGSRAEKALRVLSDGTAQLAQTYTNSVGNLTKAVDPLGRTTEYMYAANGVDLVAVKQTSGGINNNLATFTYNGQHLPLTQTDAAGQTTTYTYNARGQVLTITNAKNETVTYGYDSNGYLTSIDGPLPGAGDVVALTYDPYGRRRTMTDVDGYTVTLDYDGMDRVTRVTYPDGTYEENTYQRLDRVTQRDRVGRIATFAFNALQEVTSVTDPLNRVVRYDWCKCGDIKSITDPLGRITRWKHDIQGRVIQQESVDGTAMRFEYESATSRLKKRIDEKGQTAIYDYYLDDEERGVSYPDAEIPTASVSFTYDPAYPRLRTMSDGSGTSTYSYHPIVSGTLGAGQLATLDGPWSNDTIGYSYDELGRVTSRAIGGVSQSVTYDATGRVIAMANPLGAFSIDYVGATLRPASVQYPNGQSTHYDYFSTAQDRRLQRIRHLKPDAAPLSVHEYAYDARGRIVSWMQQEDGGAAKTFAFNHDPAGQLTGAVLTQGSSTLKTFAYTYDLAGNRTTEVIDGLTTTFSFNALNQLTRVNGSLPDTGYEWDAENQLRAVTRGSTRSEFEYDGLGRRIGITEKVGSTVVAANRYLWCGVDLCEERDAAGGAVEQRFLGLGRQVTGGTNAPGNYFHSKDHLGSLREITTSSGALTQRVAYDPWGRATFSNPTFATRIGFTGQLYHGATGLMLAPSRAYSAEFGRWISPDPLSPAGPDGPNVYAYVRNDPILYFDSEGEFANFAIGAISSVAMGWAIAQITGDCYSWKDAALDAATGAAGAGVLSKANKLYRVSKLRSIAKSRGLTSAGKKGYTETWKGGSNAYERLNIKFEAGKSPGLQSGSKVPRFDYRTDAGKYWDPFTGRTGPKGDLSHVPLEPTIPRGAAAAGAAAGAASPKCCD